MRLLILTQYFWPEEFRINDLVTELDRRGHKICVLTGWPSYPQRANYPEYRDNPDAFARLGNVEIVRVPLFPRGKGGLSLIANYVSFAMSAATLGALRMRGRSFDAILVNQISPATIGFPGVVLRYLKRAPIFLWIQDLWPDSLEAAGGVRSPFILSSVSFLMGAIYAHTDHILVQSRAFLDRLRPRVKPGIPITHVPNWAQPGAEGDVDEPADRPMNGHTPFSVYYFGNLGESQDFPAVLDAVASLEHRNDLHWYLVGDGRREDWIREQLALRGLDNRVTLLGRFPQRDMPGLYSRADALLVSLKNERAFELTVPSKVQTYLASGIPIVGMLNGEGARILRESGAGYVCDAGDSSGLADGVTSMMNLSPDERRRMGEAGRAYNKREFDFHRIVDRLEQLLSTPR